MYQQPVSNFATLQHTFNYVSKRMSQYMYTFLAKLIIDNCLSVSVCFFFLTFLKIKLKVTNNNKGKKEVDYEKEVSTNSFCTLALRVATKVSFYLIFEYWFKICVCYICNVLLLIENSF